MRTGNESGADSALLLTLFFRKNENIVNSPLPDQCPVFPWTVLILVFSAYVSYKKERRPKVGGDSAAGEAAYLRV
jgi:hypothetical protein